MTTLLLAGATGLIGRHALALSLADDRVTMLVAPTRRPLPSHPKLLNPIVDARALPLDAERWDVDGAMCAIGTTRAKAGSAAAFRAVDFDYAFAIADCLRKSGTSRFALVSSVGADVRSRFLYTRTKGEIEQALIGLGFPSCTILRPGFLTGERDEYRPMERFIGGFLKLAAPFLPAAARASPAPAVAALLVEAAVAGEPGTHIISSATIGATRPQT